MGAFENALAKFCVQTAVYWGDPVADGTGGFTYSAPVEISCRWDDSVRAVSDGKGNEILCRAEVMVTQDVDEEGVLFLGMLDDLDSDQENNPETIAAAYKIKRFDKIPAAMSTTEFFRRAFL